MAETYATLSALFTDIADAIREKTGDSASIAAYYFPDMIRERLQMAPPPYLTFSSPNSFTLKVGNTTKSWDGTLEYSTDTFTWSTWDGTAILSSAISGSKNVLYLRGTGNTVITGNNQNYRWFLTGTDIKCIGNIENLLDYSTVKSGEHPTMANYCYYYMFSNCTALTQAPALPAMMLTESCYYRMFNGCTGLTQAPDLPATTLADSCYNSMFYACTSLTQAPALPATTLADYCYYYMFRGCSGLTQAPALPATTLANGCYRYMFMSCTSLTQAPALPATTLMDRCYYCMFSNCTSLKLSDTKTGEYSVAYRIPFSGTGTTVSNALTNMFVSTGGTFTGTPSINTTYYLSNTNQVISQVTLISFTVDGVSYQAEEGMTWTEWCESAYNTGGFYIQNTKTIYKNGVSGFVCYSYSNVLPSDLIVEDRLYYMGNDKS